MDTWKEILQAEGLPLDCQISFHLQNGGLGRVFLQGRQIAFSKPAKFFAKAWLVKYRALTSLTLFRQSISTEIIEVEFHNGVVNGSLFFGNRNQINRGMRAQFFNAVIQSV